MCVFESLSLKAKLGWWPRCDFRNQDGLNLGPEMEATFIKNDSKIKRIVNALRSDV